MSSAVDSLATLENTSGSRTVGQIPGYQGYCPQFKYKYGKTFGQQTYELTQESRDEGDCSTAVDYNSLWAQRKKLSKRYETNSEIPERDRKLPLLTTGDRTRYSHRMIPGYTGYIPRWPFKFGNTYKNECNVCLDEFGAIQRMDELDRQSSLMFPRPVVVQADPSMSDYINQLHHTHSTSKMLDLEPPIPGYKGFIPHVRTSDVGLGSRFRNMAREGYQTMVTQRYEQQQQQQQQQQQLFAHTDRARMNSSQNFSRGELNGTCPWLQDRQTTSAAVAHAL